ncbi:MAG TPA: type II toxin-antitoxin system mRNA interferase toxin, RelE/StbE family [Yinghuangia sp.]|uniref:type II toxin-antitoxin system RelE family toxin n=1 Tax=Yinghuangia sp. YIM S10712 TaxID=3436930 RepID=UPI002C343C28|nr:type II toxin-antitoxin system mRNA interferase toxin, RelE/StbE family [Yinghuangia sp.]
MAEVAFTDDAIDDLRRIGPDAVPKVLKKILMLVDEPTAGHPLGGELTGYRKLVVGRNTWRVVYRIVDDKTVEVCEVWAVGARADAEVYAEAIARVRDASADRPELMPLARAIERLGRLAGDIKVPAAKPVEPVPDWLAERLVHSAGLTREEVASLSLEEAVDRWAEFVSRPRR